MPTALCEQMNDVVPGKYVYSIRLEGYETYTSNPFTVISASDVSQGTMRVCLLLLFRKEVYTAINLPSN